MLKCTDEATIGTTITIMIESYFLKIRKLLGDDVAGKCYAASEALYHLIDGKNRGITPIQGTWEGVSHWALRHPSGRVTDLTVDQFVEIPDYNLFRGKGFLTKNPSKKAQAIIDKVGTYGQ